MAVVLAYSRMIPRIEARERLAAIDDRALAAGNLEQHDARRIKRQLQAASRGEPLKATKASAAALAGMGIAARTVASEASEGGVSDG